MRSIRGRIQAWEELCLDFQQEELVWTSSDQLLYLPLLLLLSLGSAAIAGLRSKKDINIFILHPKGRVSPIQEAQMTTVLDANVHNVAVEGTFDDCQVSLSL